MLSMEEVYQHHAQTVWRYLMAQTHDPGLAEELTQETFYQAVRTAHKFDGTSAVPTWLCGIAKNVLRTYRRRHPPQDDLPESALTAPSPEGDVLARQQHLEVLRALQKLPERTREVMYLRLYGDLSFREIAQVLSLTENYARVTFYRGKEALRKELTDHDA